MHLTQREKNFIFQAFDLDVTLTLFESVESNQFIIFQNLTSLSSYTDNSL